MALISEVNITEQKVNVSFSVPISGWKTLDLKVLAVTRIGQRELVRSEVSLEMDRDTVQMLVNELTAALLR